MKRLLSRLALILLTLGWASSVTGAKPLSQLKVLYVGTERGPQYVAFLQPKVAHIETRTVADFSPADATRFDVVLLDWPQNSETRDLHALKPPLGRRQDWAKPTVLLGSAGLNLAVAWQMKGGIGCTCLDPLAYDLRPHEIFDGPFPIDRGQLISIPTPAAFSDKIKEPTIQVLPLVDDRGRSWKAGWCTYSYDFAANPDVEFFCGGVNHKVPSCAGLWRQGNLLHFGFEQSPAEMNEQGRRLLLNSIAYISRFSEDRPIGTTPSIFAGPIARPRETPGRWLRTSDTGVRDIEIMFEPKLWRSLPTTDTKALSAWLDKNQRYLHPTPEHQLEIDPDLVAFGEPFDGPDFFTKAFADLRGGEPAVASRARRLLERYVPIGPKNADADQWSAWWKENQAYAFACDAGDYCWYIDPLAKKRGIPTAELRGPSRADLTN